MGRRADEDQTSRHRSEYRQLCLVRRHYTMSSAPSDPVQGFDKWAKVIGD
jgi:hypothetical protein